MKIKLMGFFLVCGVILLRAQPARNPFFFEAAPSPAKVSVVAPSKPVPPPPPALVLQGIWISKAHRYAVVNGAILSEGEGVLGWKVVQIEAKVVFFQNGTQSKKLVLPD